MKIFQGVTVTGLRNPLIDWVHVIEIHTPSIPLLAIFANIKGHQGFHHLSLAPLSWYCNSPASQSALAMEGVGSHAKPENLIGTSPAKG